MKAKFKGKVLLSLATKSSKSRAEVIEGFFNRETRTLVRWRQVVLTQTKGIPIIQFAVKQRNLCITYLRNIRVAEGSRNNKKMLIMTAPFVKRR